MKVSYIVKTHSLYFKRLAKHANLKVCLDSLFNEPNMHLTRYHLFFEALTKVAEESEAQIYRKVHAWAKETSRRVNNMLVLGRVKGVPNDVNIFKQGDLTLRGQLGRKVPKRSGFGSWPTLGMISKKTSIQPIEVFFFEQSVIICNSKGKRGLIGTTEYSFSARFPMNRIQVENAEESLSLDIIIKAPEAPMMTLVAKDQAEKMMRGSFGINPEERESKSVPQSLCLVTK